MPSAPSRRVASSFALLKRLAVSGLLALVSDAAAIAQVDSGAVAPHVRAPLTDAVRQSAAANNAFGFDLFGSIRADIEPGQNLMFSPLSVSTALGMTYAGARGANAAEMARVLHLDGLGDAAHAGFGGILGDLNTPREGYQLSVANRLFGQRGYPFKAEFLDRLSGDYAAPLEELDFLRQPEASRLHINDWVEDQTRDKIQDLLPDGSISEDVRLVLANALYFKGPWKYRFDEQATHDQSFYLPDQSVAQVPTMYQRAHFGYGRFDGYQMLEMPYAGDDLSMVVLLPEERGGLAELEASLTPQTFDAGVAALRRQQVDVFLPKFTFRDEAQLGAPLRELGMRQAFRDGDFTGIADDALAISEVFHKTFIEVNESGTEAAAATAVVIVAMSHSVNPPPPPVFRADHPFLFALRDRHTGAVLFLGRMADPGAANANALVPEPGAASLLLGGFMAVAGAARRSHRPR